MEYVVLALIIILFALIFLTIFSFYIAFYVNRKKKVDIYKLPNGYGYDKNRELMIELTKQANEAPYEEICITSFDGLKLFARYYHLSDKAPLQIQFHGYRGCCVRDMSGGSKLAKQLNYNVLLVDQRAHGKSGGKVITFGIKERKDVLSWINYCNSRFGKDKEIVLSGVSMGASCVIMALDQDLPDNVKGVIADCPYSSIKEIIIAFTNRLKLPGKLFYPFIYLGARILGNVNLHETSAIKAIKNSKIPVLIIHGNKDDIVPYNMSKSIQQANPTMCSLEIFDNAGHGLSYIEDYKRYEKVVLDFEQKIKKS